MRTPMLACGLAAGLVAIAAGPTEARHRHTPHAALGVPAGMPPSTDAVELAGIAPPARAATEAQTYGDAAFARARAQNRQRREEQAETAATGGAPYPCDPREATADAYVCRNDPRVLGYGQGYAFTPSYVTSPNVLGQDPAEQAPIMPAITGALWTLNTARIDPH